MQVFFKYVSVSLLAETPTSQVVERYQYHNGNLSIVFNRINHTAAHGIRLGDTHCLITAPCRV